MNKNYIRLCCWLALAFAVTPGSLLAQTNTEESSPMSQQLGQVASQLSEFEKTKLLDHLRSAVRAMETMPVAGAHKEVTLATDRRQQVKMWLRLLAAIDRSQDPNFDPNETFQMSLIPPSSGGVQFPSGVDPRVIKDPKTRADYEAALKANREKAERANFHVGLHQIDTHASLDVERLLRFSYTNSETDKKELAEILEQSTLSDDRKQKLKNIISKEESGGQQGAVGDVPY